MRKDVNLNSKRYNYFPQKVGEGKIIESPAGKVLKVNKLSKPETKDTIKIEKKNTLWEKIIDILNFIFAIILKFNLEI